MCPFVSSIANVNLASVIERVMLKVANKSTKIYTKYYFLIFY